MELHLCSCCGAHLTKVDDHYECEYCGSRFEDDFEKKCAHRVEEVLEQAKLDALSKAKRVLYDATHAKFISQEDVRTATMAVLTIDPDDDLARFHRAALDEDPSSLNEWLLSAPISASLAKEVIRYSLLSLNPRNVFALKDFCQRQLGDEDRLTVMTQIENEAAKFEEGLYEPSLPRDIFLCYSGKDQERVLKVCDYLEDNGFTVFAAYRNLRHGQGAVENYMKALEAAMRACKTVVFLSSKNSRSVTCDAITRELPYIKENRPKMGRIEYILDSYQSQPRIPQMVTMLIKDTFKDLEWCTNKEDLLRRLFDLTRNHETKVCPSCGTEVDADARFCPKCSFDFQAKKTKAVAPTPRVVEEIDLRKVMTKAKHVGLVSLKAIAVFMFALAVIWGFIPGAMNKYSGSSTIKYNYFESFFGVLGVPPMPIVLLVLLAFSVIWFFREVKYGNKGRKFFIVVGFICAVLGIGLGILTIPFYAANAYDASKYDSYHNLGNAFSGFPLLLVGIFQTIGGVFALVNAIAEIKRGKKKE